MTTLMQTLTYAVIECSQEGCGVSFALSDEFIKARRHDHATWYCPNGHARHYPARNQVEEAKAEAARLSQQLDWQQAATKRARVQAEAERRSAIAFKGHATRLRNRAAAGCCPACNRTFQNLQRHMAGQHPAFGKDQ